MLLTFLIRVLIHNPPDVMPKTTEQIEKLRLRKQKVIQDRLEMQSLRNNAMTMNRDKATETAATLKESDENKTCDQKKEARKRCFYTKKRS